MMKLQYMNPDYKLTVTPNIVSVFKLFRVGPFHGISFVSMKYDFLSFSPQEAHFNRLVSRFGQSKSGILPHFFIWIDQEYFNSLN